MADEGAAVGGPGALPRGSPAGRRPSARRRATRERVLDAAREVFAERGIIGGTVEEICERAGFTRGAFYSNFADKEDILGAVIARERERLLAYADTGFARLMDEATGDLGVDPVGTLAHVADQLLGSIPADRLFSLVQDELEIHAVRDPASAPAFVEADARFRDGIADFLERGLRLLGRELAVDRRDATDTAVAIVQRSYRRALLAGGDADPNALAVAVLPQLILALSRPVEAAGA
ncbi:MAG: TetR/AcrR family transcriptional regulator [Chloroflexi bacterium]|jgi:AcrR family transcriptional regulator|nr:TetR/AcrR family transcriptional regulator [Chloroflexota bacterium]